MTVFPDDLFVVSYPRSGNTWTRFLLGNLIYQDEPITFANVERRLPQFTYFPIVNLAGFLEFSRATTALIQDTRMSSTLSETRAT